MRNTFPGLTLVAIIVLASPAAAHSLRLDIRFTNPVINFDPVSFGLSELPSEINAVFVLEGGRTSSSGTTTYVASDILSASVPIGDADFTVMDQFWMEVQADQTISAINWIAARRSTPSVIDGGAGMNPPPFAPLFISGTNRANGSWFSYTYFTSMETITVLPEPSSLSLLLLALTGARSYRR